jgi:SpoIID/LytB domain protein
LRSAIRTPYLAAVAALLAWATPAQAASTLYISGGGDGHGIGMSQYGAYGYALHGKSYRFILAHYYEGTKLGTVNPNQVVRVLLATGSSSFSGATAAGGKRLSATTSYTARANSDGTVTLVAGGRRIGTFAAPLTITAPGPLTFAGDQYHGALVLRPDGAGGVETVDAVDLEDYVRGVVSAEMPASWSAEALKAQAVAARSYAITSDVGGSSFQVYSDTRSQMYRGVAAETSTTDAAVAATRGQVVTYDGHAVTTFFFASSGGHTENIEDVWPGATPEPWLRGVPDPYDGAGGDPYHRWKYRLSLGVATAKLGQLVKGQLVGIQVLRHGSSPRIMTAAVIGTRGRTLATGAELQQAFGLLSTYVQFTTA